MTPGRRHYPRAKRKGELANDLLRETREATQCGRKEDECVRQARLRITWHPEEELALDEPECGHHYARAMSAWATLLAWTGFGYDALDQHIRFKSSAKPVTWFWSNGNAWGTCTQTPGAEGGAKAAVRLNVLAGEITLKTISLSDRAVTLDAPRQLKSLDSFDAVV